MTVKELIERLNKYPDNTDVFIQKTNDEYGLSLCEDCKQIEANFSEDTGPVLATDIVLIITDEI